MRGSWRSFPKPENTKIAANRIVSTKYAMAMNRLHHRGIEYDRVAPTGASTHGLIHECLGGTALAGLLRLSDPWRQDVDVQRPGVAASILARRSLESEVRGRASSPPVSCRLVEGSSLIGEGTPQAACSETDHQAGGPGHDHADANQCSDYPS